MCVCVLDSGVILALFLSVMLILWLCGEALVLGPVTLKWIRKVKVFVCVHACAEQERERASLVKCEWLVDPNGG